MLFVNFVLRFNLSVRKGSLAPIITALVTEIFKWGPAQSATSEGEEGVPLQEGLRGGGTWALELLPPGTFVPCYVKKSKN